MMEVFLHYRCRLCNHYFTLPTAEPKQVAVVKAISGVTDESPVHNCNENQAGVTEMVGVSWKEPEKK